MYKIDALTDLMPTLVLIGIANFLGDDSTVIDGIVTIEHSMGLEVDTDDIEELFEDHCIGLPTEELEDLQNKHEVKLKNRKMIKKMFQVL